MTNDKQNVDILTLLVEQKLPDTACLEIADSVATDSASAEGRGHHGARRHSAPEDVETIASHENWG